MDVIIYLDHDLILDVMYMIYLSPQTGAAPPAQGCRVGLLVKPTTFEARVKTRCGFYRHTTSVTSKGMLP